MRRYSPKWWPEYSGITGRDQMESVTGMKWNQWPGSNGMGDRNGMESMAGIVWNMQRGTELLATLPLLMRFTEMRDFSSCSLPFQFSPGKMNMVWHQSYQEDEQHKWLRREIVKVVESLPEK